MSETDEPDPQSTGQHEGPDDRSGDQYDESDDPPDTESEWRERLSEEEYRVLREQGTEQPYSGEHVDRDEDGTYTCTACGAVLFDADEKFDAGCGWPSFWDVADDDAIETRPDHSHGMERTEVVCANCGGHLGHVFEDGPQPTGLRYCINSVALDFDPAAE